MSNHTCPSEYKPVDPVPFYTNGSLNFKAHDVGWIICGFFSLIASGASFWLIWKHLTYYSCPQQQRHIVRMLFMVPIYAVVSTLSYIFYHHAIYYQTIRDCYEAVVITSFFYLLLQYVADTPAQQHEVFRSLDQKIKKKKGFWFFPFGFWKYRPTGLHFLWLMKICILQYAIVRPLCTLIAVGMQYMGIYCLESWAPYFGHIYISIAISISVSVAMYCIIQFYLPIQEELKPYSPVLKFLAVKSVVFLTFWQESFLSILVYFGAIKESDYMSAADIQVGISALLQTLEMVIFGFLHIKAFTYVIYRPKDRERTTKRFKAFLDVLDYRDWWYQMRQTSRYVVAKSSGKTFTIADDIRREKFKHLEMALGSDRWSQLSFERKEEGKLQQPNFWKDGCEPTEEEQEEQQSLANEEKDKVSLDDDREKNAMMFYSSSYAYQPKSSFTDLPKGNIASRADYDPEKDFDEDFPLDAESLLKEKRTTTDDQESRRLQKLKELLPTLPSIDVESIRGSRKPNSEKYPELSQYHQPQLRSPTNKADATDGDSETEEQQDIFVPRKGTRARKEASSGFGGAFWRSFVERISNGNERKVDEEEQEKEPLGSSSGPSNDALNQPEHAEGDRLDEREQRVSHSMPYLYTDIKDNPYVPADRSPSPPLDIHKHHSPLAQVVNEHASGKRRSHNEPNAYHDHERQREPRTQEQRYPSLSRQETQPQAAPRHLVQVQNNALAIERENAKSKPSPAPTAVPTGKTNVVLNGPRGRAISLVLPTPLSTRLPLEPPSLPPLTLHGQETNPKASSSVGSIPLVQSPLPIDEARSQTRPGPGSSASRSFVGPYSGTLDPASFRPSSSRIRFSEQQKPASKSAKDDPEADLPNFDGYVVAGGQSLKQARAQQESLRQQRLASANLGQPRQPSMQQQADRRPQWGSATSELLNGGTVYDRYTGEPRRSILQRPPPGHDHHRDPAQRQHAPRPHPHSQRHSMGSFGVRQDSAFMASNQLGLETNRRARALPSNAVGSLQSSSQHSHRHHRNSYAGNASRTSRGRAEEETREGFQFEYVD